mgnify:CR=1 FL=1
MPEEFKRDDDLYKNKNFYSLLSHTNTTSIVLVFYLFKRLFLIQYKVQRFSCGFENRGYNFQ